ncbi:MAG: tRNA (adenosine(37)-N6)-dimethylallyltransferase MiaA [Alphaproteobacteria bacterium]|nr:tRNA (adenosine(37)-N6)-dimethylallyltransferase MiaA [Alphaproteobacteria bacterium]
MTPVLVIAGPTASGKSRLALDLAAARRGTVINADSMQVYRELRILTARPGAAEMARAPHRLYGVLSAAEPCSAARWRVLALAAIEEARSQGRLPILVGGTGLYLRALFSGLAEIPPIPQEVREAARARQRDLGGEAFRAELARRDPESAARLAAGDTQRLVRAWEVVEATGRTLPEWQRAGGAGTGAHVYRTILLMPPRDALYAACDARFGAMVTAGALDEVRALLAFGLDPALPALKSLGVRELARHLAGEWTLEQAEEKARQATRNYAKRQTTWFRHQLAPDLVLERPDSAAATRLLAPDC